jgi:hypothetical protein
VALILFYNLLILTQVFRALFWSLLGTLFGSLLDSLFGLRLHLQILFRAKQPDLYF